MRNLWLFVLLSSLLSVSQVHADLRRPTRIARTRDARLGSRRPAPRARRTFSTPRHALPTLQEGVREALQALHSQGIPVAVASNAIETRVHTNNARLGVEQYITRAIGARDRHGRIVRDRKPAPGMLLTLANDLGVAPSQMVYVGDTPADIQAARRAGMISIALSTRYGAATPDELREAAPDVFLTGGFGEVPTAIAALRRSGRDIRAVGIDMDGTYIDVWPEYRETALAALREIGVSVSRAQLTRALDARPFSAHHYGTLNGIVPRRLVQAFRVVFMRRYSEAAESARIESAPASD